MREMRPVADEQGATSRLDAVVCALLVVQAELACLPAESEHWQGMRAQRDRLLARLTDWQREQLRHIGASLDELMAPTGRSKAA